LYVGQFKALYLVLIELMEISNMPRKTTHVTPHKDGWQVKSGGSDRAYRVTKTKAQAEAIGRPFSQGRESEFIIHGSDGKIQRADSHGGDPFPPRDKK
jgi:hypothetical protein